MVCDMMMNLLETLISECLVWDLKKLLKNKLSIIHICQHQNEIWILCTFVEVDNCDRFINSVY
jgi:hypothetical protein